jgi:hypothetical protein
VSGGLRRRVILDFQGLLLFLFSLFWLSRRDSTSSNMGVGFVLFLLLFSAALFPLTIIGDFRSSIFNCGASAFLPLQSTVVVFAIFTAATYPTTSHRRLSLRTRSFA